MREVMPCLAYYIIKGYVTHSMKDGKNSFDLRSNETTLAPAVSSEVSSIGVTLVADGHR